MLLLRVIDDRDRATMIPLAYTRELPAWWRRKIGPWSWRRSPANAWAVLRTPAVVLGIAAACLFGVLARLLFEDTAMFLGLIVFGPVMVPLLTLALLAGRGALGLGRGLGPMVRDAMLAADRCPACGYDLAGSPVEPDACRVCPECGAAWILPRDRSESVEVTVSTGRKRVWASNQDEDAQKQGPGTLPGP